MKYTSLSLLFSLSFLLIECKKSNEEVVPPSLQQTTKYFVKVTAGDIAYSFDVSKNVINVSPLASRFFVSADSADFSYHVSFATTRALTGKPESVSILGGNFARSRSDTYETVPGSVNGMCTITKIDDTIVEGTFYFDVYKGTRKLTLKDGSFKLKVAR